MIFCSTFSNDNYWIYLIAGGKFFQSSSFTILYIYCVEFYPTKIRSMGLGFGLCFARIAGILTPLVSTLLIDLHIKIPYVSFGITSFFSIGAAMCLEIETLNRTLDSKI